MGIAEVFGPGASLDAIVRAVREAVAAKRRAEDGASLSAG
jgi:hypothetical protein